MTYTRLFLLWLLIIIPFAAGSFCKKRLASPEKTAKLLIRISVTCIEPLIILWSMWGINLHRGYSALPVGGLFLVVFGFVIGSIITRPARITGVSRTTFIISSSLANHGFTMGGIICFLFMGEKGLALSFSPSSSKASASHGPISISHSNFCLWSA